MFFVPTHSQGIKFVQIFVVLFLLLIDDDIFLVCEQAGKASSWGSFPWPPVGPGPL